MRLYEVTTANGSEFFVSKAAALRAARDFLKAWKRNDAFTSTEVEVEQLEVLKPSRALVLQLLNELGGYVVSRKTIATFDYEGRE